MCSNLLYYSKSGAEKGINEDGRSDTDQDFNATTPLSIQIVLTVLEPLLKVKTRRSYLLNDWHDENRLVYTT